MGVLGVRSMEQHNRIFEFCSDPLVCELEVVIVVTETSYWSLVDCLYIAHTVFVNWLVSCWACL
jgi:hypothetical protein